MDKLSQTSKILRLCKRTNGAANYELAAITHRFSARLGELRKDMNIIAVRQTFNGKVSNVWRYYLIEGKDLEEVKMKYEEPAKKDMFKNIKQLFSW